ncbi:hypothetical protein KCU98_g3603, partial [Aureobasidium melanogenum]
MDEQSIRSSQRVSRSCIECSRRKIKCDKKIPCKPCVRRNLAHECQRPITRVRGMLTVASTVDRLSADSEDNSVDQLLKERCALQAQIAELETALALSKPCGHTHGGKPDIHRPGQAPVPAFEELVPALEQFDLQVSHDSDPITMSEKDMADRLYEPSTDPVFLLLPSREISEQLVTFSLRTLGWLHGAVNAPEFVTEHEEFWNKIHSGVALDVKDRPWLALYFALLATGLLYLDPEEVPAISDLPQLNLHQYQQHDELRYAVHTSRLWYEVALKEVERYGCSGSPSLRIVQALSVLTLCHSNYGEPQREWLFTGWAASIARCLDMHRLGSEVAHSRNVSVRPEWSSFEKRELGRRVWWTYVIRDWLGSWSRPPSITPASFCCKFSTENDANHDAILETPTHTSSPSPLVYQSVMCRLSYIFYIYIKVNTHQNASKFIKALEEIEIVKRNLPLHLSTKFPANIDDEEWEATHPWITFQRYLINHSIEFMMLSIARTLAMGNIGSETTRYRDAAMAAATNIIHSYLAPVARVYKLVWTVSASTVAAAVYTSLDILMNPQDYTPQKRQEHIAVLKQVVQELGKYSHVAIHAAKGSATIQKLISRLEQDFSMSHLSVHDILRHLTTQEMPSTSAGGVANGYVLPAQSMSVPVDGWNEMMVGHDMNIPHMDQGHIDGLLGPSDTWNSFMEFPTFQPQSQHQHHQQHYAGEARFAVVNVDARGAGDSDGSIVIMGKQEGENGHDVIEELAKMDWQVTYPRFSTCCSLTSVQNVRAMVAINITWENCPYPDTASIPESDYSNLMIYFGPTGILRASHSKTDPARAIHPQYPFHTHDEVQKITPGTVVELEIGLWAMGMDFKKVRA